MPKFIHLKAGEQLASLTGLRPDEIGENTIHTQFVEPVKMTDDPGDAGLQLGRRIKGSIRPVLSEDGSLVLQVRPYQTAEEPNPVPETLHATEHGRLYRTSRRTRIVFEFAHNASFDKISDALDDEVYELRQYLDHSIE